MRNQLEVDNVFNDLLKEAYNLDAEWHAWTPKSGEKWTDKNNILKRHTEINVILHTLNWVCGVNNKL